MEKHLYLAGPILGTAYDACTSWRQYVCEKLPSDIIGITPMRGKESLSGQQEIKVLDRSNPITATKGIITRDRFDLMRCDMVLMNLLGATKVSIGSMIELGWADAFRKTVVLVIEEGNCHMHAIVQEIAGFIVPTLDQGIEVVKSILSYS